MGNVISSARTRTALRSATAAHGATAAAVGAGWAPPQNQRHSRRHRAFMRPTPAAKGRED